MVQISESRRPIPDSKAERRQKEILEAASRVFRRRGLHATGMREIADESGMHVGNLYYYFQNKQQLLAYCQQETLSALMALAEDVRQQSLPADEELFRLIVGHVVLLNDEMPGSLAHLEVEALDDPWKRRIVRQRNRYESILQRLIEEGIESELFRAADPAVTSRAILGAINWTVKWFQPRGRQTSRQIGSEIAVLVIRGLLAEDRQTTLTALEGSPDTDRESMKGST